MEHNRFIITTIPKQLVFCVYGNFAIWANNLVGGIQQGLGFLLGKALVVDNLFWGMIYHGEIFHDVNIGERYRAFVKAVRPDGKIDLRLGDRELKRVKSLADVILEYLAANGGSMRITDSSSPEMIRAVFSCSKKDFKKTLGFLYKAKKIIITPQEVALP